MIRFLVNFLVQLALAAVALLLAAWLVPGVGLNFGGFFVAVGVFAVAQAILAPFVFNLARRYASAVLGGVGLVSTFLALWIASLFPGGLQISDLTAWIIAPLLVWIVTALGTWILGALVIDKWLKRREDDKTAARVASRAK